MPSFRRDFGFESDDGYILAARWQSAFNSISSVGGMFGGLSLGYVSDKFGCVCILGPVRASVLIVRSAF